MEWNTANLKVAARGPSTRFFPESGFKPQPGQKPPAPLPPANKILAVAEGGGINYLGMMARFWSGMFFKGNVWTGAE